MCWEWYFTYVFMPVFRVFVENKRHPEPEARVMCFKWGLVHCEWRHLRIICHVGCCRFFCGHRVRYLRDSVSPLPGSSPWIWVGADWWHHRFRVITVATQPGTLVACTPEAMRVCLRALAQINFEKLAAASDSAGPLWHSWGMWLLSVNQK